MARFRGAFAWEDALLCSGDACVAAFLIDAFFASVPKVSALFATPRVAGDFFAAAALDAAPFAAAFFAAVGFLDVAGLVTGARFAPAGSAAAFFPVPVAFFFDALCPVVAFFAALGLAGATFS